MNTKQPGSFAKHRPPHNSSTQWVSLFFDGEGQDLELDELRGRMSNIGKLFKAHPGVRAQGIYRFYYRGSGTLSGNLGPLADTTGYPPLGASMALDLQYQLRHAVYDLAQTFGEAGSSQPRLGLFGFGRGAALAWQLCCLLAQQGVPNPHNANSPFRLDRDFRICFLGLFDTTGTHGLDFSAANGAPLGAIPDCVGFVLHCVAAHERRAAFELQSLRDIPTQPTLPNRQECLYPGMHSDVGGGYRPEDQGRCNALARIPLNQMLDSAIAQGIPFSTLDRLRMIDPGLYREFLVPSELHILYEDYCKRLHPETDLFRELAHHECLYFRWLHHHLSRPIAVDEILVQLNRNQGIHALQLEELDRICSELVGKNSDDLNQDGDNDGDMTTPTPARQSVVLTHEDSPKLAMIRFARNKVLTELDRTRAVGQRLQQSNQALKEEFASATWRQAFLDGGFPEFDAPDSAFFKRRDDQLSETDVLYRHRGEWALVVKPLRPFERDLLTWMKIPEPLPETMQRFMTRYLHDAIAHTPVPGDLYFQRRSIFFRSTRPWRG